MFRVWFCENELEIFVEFFEKMTQHEFECIQVIRGTNTVSDLSDNLIYLAVACICVTLCA